MKLKNLKINSHYHLKDLEFDFTYPKGHTKEGQLLDKVCIIGQSATGKTKILNLIFDELEYLLHFKISDVGGVSLSENYIKELDGELAIELIEEEFDEIKSDIVSNNNYVIYDDQEYDLTNNEGEVFNYLISNGDDKIIYFESNYLTNENIKHFKTNPLEFVFDDSKKDEDNNVVFHYRFKESQNDEYILKLLKSFLDFRQKYDQKIRELLLGGVISDLDKFNREFKEWQIENPNPIVEFSKRFDRLLDKLNLEIDKVNVDYPIPFKNKITNEIIPIDGLSTGTKGLLLYMLPLYQIDTDKSIILIDEPERSLYPDMQMEIMDFYRGIAPNAQFIIATHSPFIAASFEPEERFILYFDEEGKVKFRNGVSPIGDDPNDILKSDFQLEYLMNKDGRNAYEKYIKLKKALAEETDKQKKDKILDELMEIGTAYKF